MTLNPSETTVCPLCKTGESEYRHHYSKYIDYEALPGPTGVTRFEHNYTLRFCWRCGYEWKVKDGKILPTYTAPTGCLLGIILAPLLLWRAK